jgi:nucleoredoxin
MELYENLAASRPGTFEVVFVSSDANEDEFTQNFGTMPWLAVPFATRWLADDGTVVVNASGDAMSQRDRLSSVFQVDGLPTLCMLGPDGDIIHLDAYEKVFQDPTAQGSTAVQRCAVPLPNSVHVVLETGAVCVCVCEAG